MPEMKLCEACGMEFDWSGVREAGAEFCCEGCARGEECACPQHNHQYRTAQSMPGGGQLGLTRE